MTKKQRSLARKILKLQNRQFGREMRMVPREEWGPDAGSEEMSAVWRSRDYCAQIHDDPSGVTRLSMCRASLNKDGSWQTGISWEEMQRVKNECGFAEREAIEIVPPQSDEVAAELRHLWLLPDGERLPFSWKRGTEAEAALPETQPATEVAQP